MKTKALEGRVGGRWGHALRGQVCSGSRGPGAQQLRVRGRRAAETPCSGQVHGAVSAEVKVKSGVLSAGSGDGCSGGERWSFRLMGRKSPKAC